MPCSVKLASMMYVATVNLLVGDFPGPNLRPDLPPGQSHRKRRRQQRRR
jgi:hypothetical protein